MTSTVDANILVHAANEDSPVHARAQAFVDRLFKGPELVYLFWPTAMAYLRISTHAGIFRRPQSISDAIANLSDLLKMPNVRAPGEGESFLARLREIVVDAAPSGNLVSDAHLVGLMLENGVRTIWTHDRDFRRFRGIEARDPFD